ncbi:BTB/POZ domain and ankyrin repeat-containing protein NPR1-like [Impatiens glandulifera]|uniref:BTB/POZ domain and ankyrin repeat-containing protein NPR1-like n=1 Tax=Impatiens glandulifera TaxID=253017 RepID=UPI001FB146C2|nr:BTB/POZ domain and ankyrin repeat-containing protein NPR1-like [Impatiens glandulifera]
MDARMTFSDSNDISGSSSICDIVNTESPGIESLRKLSENLESIFNSSIVLNSSFSDATIIVEGDREIPVHRCILSARSPYFKNAFSGKERGVKLEFEGLLKDINLSFDVLAIILAYLYTGKVKPLPDGVCVCADEDCSHVTCRPAVDFFVGLLYASFTFQISELVSLYQRRLLDILDKVVADDLLPILSASDVCGNACEKLFIACIHCIVKSDIDVVTLERTLSENIVKQIMDLRLELGLDEPALVNFPDKHVKRIHRALESDDVELLGMLLNEAHTTLDDACALHYAVAFCNSKTTMDLLNLTLADINRRNSRGYTVLHIASMRKEPKIIVSLLTKGAQPSDLTPDGRNALQISKRLTKALDYYKPKEEGKISPTDGLCIEILEQAEGRAPALMLGEASVSLALAGDDVRTQLLYFENRVTLARLLFPMEAKVAMEIAQVNGTLEFLLTATGVQKTVDLNDAPFKIKEEHLNRLRALSKTVELGKRFFPRCSREIDKIMDAEDLSELARLENETEEDRQVKKRRFMELQEIVGKAFVEDKEEYDRNQNICSSSTNTTSNKLGKNRRRFTAFRL